MGHGAWGNEIPDSKHQITNKSQAPIFNDQNKKQVWSTAGGLVIVICLIFGICDLEFLSRQNSSTSRPLSMNLYRQRVQ